MPKLAIQRDDGTVVATRDFPVLFGRMLLDRHGGPETDPLPARLERVLDQILAEIGQGSHRDSWGSRYGDWLAEKKGKSKAECAQLGFNAVEALPDV